MNKLLIAGTVAYDSLKTPLGERERVLGGAGTHAAVSASLLTPVNLVSVIGDDFESHHLTMLKERGVDTEGIEVIKGGKTFFWKGYYEGDMNLAHTERTDLNVLTRFDPKLSPAYRESEFVFVANSDPDIQLKILKQMKMPKLTAMDTMNYWIQNKKESLLSVIKTVGIVFINDEELRQLTGIVSLIKAAKSLINDFGLLAVIVKKGEHGQILITENTSFSLPAYPVESAVDPTGCGDSFAGGFMSYLVKMNTFSQKTMRQAMVYGSIVASFTIEDFGCERLRGVSIAEVRQRINEFKSLIAYETLEL